LRTQNSREILETELGLVFKQYGTDRNITETIKKDLSNHGISIGLTQGLLNESTPLESQSLVILCLLTEALYKVTKEEKINPIKYFTELEISEARKYKRETNEKQDYVELDDVIQIADDQWITRMTYKQIADLWASGQARYNKDTQRNTTIKEYGDKIVEKINVNKTGIKNIVKKMSEETYIPNVVTFNMLAGTEDYEFNGRKMRISSPLDATDGFHRDVAIGEVVSLGLHVDKYMEVRITNFDIEKCHQFMLQEDIRNPLDTRFKKAISIASENSIVKQLNERGKNELRGKITTEPLMYQKNKAYVLNDVLADAIKSSFAIKPKMPIKDLDNITDFLIEGFNEIIGLFYDDFTNLNKSRKENVKTLSSTFIGYVSILANLKDSDNWKKELESILNKIDFSLSNPMWKDDTREDYIDIKNINPSKPTMQRIRKYFKSIK
jgi:hypothetical protein